MDIPNFTQRTQSGRDTGTPQPVKHSSVRDYNTTFQGKTRDVITQKELRGVCERNLKQSYRQRIVIARSQDPVKGSHAGTARGDMFEN